MCDRCTGLRGGKQPASEAERWRETELGTHGIAAPAGGNEKKGHALWKSGGVDVRSTLPPIMSHFIIYFERLYIKSRCNPRARGGATTS